MSALEPGEYDRLSLEPRAEKPDRLVRPAPAPVIIPADATSKPTQVVSIREILISSTRFFQLIVILFLGIFIVAFFSGNHIGSTELLIAATLLACLVCLVTIELAVRSRLRSDTHLSPSRLPAARMVNIGLWRVLRLLRGLVLLGLISIAVASSFHAEIAKDRVALLYALAAAIAGSFVVERALQRRRNRLANLSFKQDVIAAANVPIALYLRAFNGSLISSAARQVVSFVSTALGVATQIAELSLPLLGRGNVERASAEVMDALGVTLVAIGDVYFTVGAAKVFVHDKTWKKTFDELAVRSRAIICELHSTPSCLWEIEKISGSQELLMKTVFVLPPTHIGGHYAKVRSSAMECGIALPEYRTEGWLFISSPKPAVYEFEEFDEALSQIVSTAIRK